MDRTKKFLEFQKFSTISNWFQQGIDVVMEELWDAPKALIAALMQLATGKHLLFLTATSRESKLFDDIPYFFGNEAIEFPSWEILPQENSTPSPDIIGERYSVLQIIQKKEKPLVIFSSLAAIFQKIIPQERLKHLYLELIQGEEYPFDTIPHLLAEMGYHRKPVAADKGEFAVRGGIIDLFPVSSPDPFRIEFWADEIVSIRKYDPLSQTSVEKVDKIFITPGEEQNLTLQEKNLSTLFDYLGPETIVILDDLEQLEDKLTSLHTTGIHSRCYLTKEEFLSCLAPFQKLFFPASPLESLTEVNIVEKSSLLPAKLSFEFFTQTFFAHRVRSPFFPLLPSFCPPNIPLEEFSVEAFLDILAKSSISALFICQSASEEKNLKEKFKKETTATLHFEQGYLSSGFYLDDPGFALIPLTELTHRYRLRRQKQRTSYQSLPFEHLAVTPGEAVVHMNSGIGRYLGTERRPNHLGIQTEFMIIEYAEGAKLYVPMEQANLVSKYIGSSEAPPEFHTLGSNRWKKTREKTEQAILDYANDLLRVQAERVVKGGFAYPPHSEAFLLFEEEFPYEETPDQLAAIESIAQDMQSDKSMDRLVCGDVGYGKTEVAMRAAFKAVMDGGRQVAVLVPTTVLAMQHYETFSDRMANFPIRIGVLSRMRKAKEIQQTLKALEEGTLDIIIGTHRLIGPDVKFKNLGLVIIDEEQRFGVKAKEHLKEIRKEVDCLTLSATPIPRTLYMSLVGARDLSVINTPPEDRLPIQSIIAAASEDLIKNALLRELARDGQAYVIHNRVETIFAFADKIRHLIPEAKIAVGHGQMNGDELDEIFHAFKAGHADILVATSIIENGIDIANANTILIDRADRFGLADLYQMRGRVGRWNRRAYCYFLVQNPKELNPVARKRLAALTQSSGQGGGMKIALHDLELRGAGNILGTEQSGHVAAIGFHLYCKLLKKTVASLQKNESPLFYHEIKIELPFDARIPEDYVNEMQLRMEIYQRLGDADTEAEINDLFIELIDRFGPLPKQAIWLQHLSRLRLFCAMHHFSYLKLSQNPHTTKVTGRANGILHAEQTHGKQEKLVQKLPIHIPEDPQALESLILQYLKVHFPL